MFLDRNNATLGSEAFIDPHRTAIQHSLQIQDVDASSGDINMSISLSVLFGTISIERNILNVGDISTQTYQFPHRLINESVNINYGEIIGPRDYLQIISDVWTLNKMLMTLSYRLPPNGNGYDFITLSAWDNGNSGSGFSNETIPFFLQVNIVSRNNPSVIFINGTDLELLYDDASVWDVGVVSAPENVVLKLGDYFQNSDPDFHSSNILGDFYELVEVPEINGVNYPTSRAKELFSPDPCHTMSTDPTPPQTSSAQQVGK